MKKGRNKFRTWLNNKGMTLQDFVSSTPGISYGFAAKCASNMNKPKEIHESSKTVIRAVYPDCPLVVDGFFNGH